jgi:hypothetical protein
MPEHQTDEAVVQQLLGLYETLKGPVYGQYIAAVDADRPYYELTFADKLVPPEWRKQGIMPVVPPTGYNSVENASDHVLTTPRFRVPIRPTEANKQEERQIAERKRQFLKFVFEGFEVDSGDPLAAGVKSVIKDGKVVIKTTINWENLPDTNDGSTPVGFDGPIWNWDMIPPSTVFEDPDDRVNPRYIFEAFQVTVGTAMARYPASVGIWKNRPVTEKIDLIEYYSRPRGEDRGIHLVWVGTDLVVDEPTPYFWEIDSSTEDEPMYDGYVPYLIRDSGWGERTPDGEPSKLFVGILRRMHSILDAEAQHQTDGSAQLKMATFPPIIGKGLGPTQKLNLGLGKVTRLPDPTMDIDFMRWPELPVSLFQMISRVSEQANELSKFGTLGGNVQRGVDTATEADANIRNAAAKLTRPVNNMRSLIKQGVRRMFQDISFVIEQPVTVFGASSLNGGVVVLDPADIEGFWHVDVEMSTTDTAALDRITARLWADLKQIYPDLSQETAMLNSGIEDPAAEQQKAASERVFASAPMEQFRTMVALVAQGKPAEEITEAFRQTVAGGSDQAAQTANGQGGGNTQNPVNAAREQNAEVVGAPITRNAQQDAQTNQSALENS